MCRAICMGLQPNVLSRLSLGDNLARREDPFYAHFPEILTMLRDAQFGRKDVTLRKFIENPSFMHHWDTQMRYCRGSEIDKHWIKDWRAQAKQVVAYSFRPPTSKQRSARHWRAIVAL